MKNCGIQPSFDTFSHKSGYKHKLHVVKTSSTKNNDFKNLSCVTPMGFHTFFMKISEILHFTFLRFILVIICHIPTQKW